MGKHGRMTLWHLGRNLTGFCSVRFSHYVTRSDQRSPHYFCVFECLPCACMYLHITCQTSGRTKHNENLVERIFTAVRYLCHSGKADVRTQTATFNTNNDSSLLLSNTIRRESSTIRIRGDYSNTECQSSPACTTNSTISYVANLSDSRLRSLVGT